ncbi:hypothetical protein PC9H_000128 [Pleurotus ostreatus]|uniref:Uncharacterized protein n=1 Tax=Pleurotus ostreatus TaxID=5322 RepID=A0A8H7DWC2_PLEOS|nr:uncharacterized protein PC9H_000128 [Pleurotus ostreatus]KAF7439792.1 hypothetical protein PC9H_000128 [Pleurotus ostreatus]
MTMLVFLAGSPDMALDLWSPPQPPKGKAMLDNVVLDPSFHLRLLLRLLNGEFLDLFRYTLEHLHYLSSDVDVDAPGIPGWKSWYGVGPVIPSKAAGDDSDVDAPGIPGWNPHAGVGPVIPSAAPSKVVKRDSDVDVPGIPGWKPIYGVGPAIPSQTSERDEENAGIPGWKPWYGVGPVVPSQTAESDAGIPGWKPVYGVGPIVTASPNSAHD